MSNIPAFISKDIIKILQKRGFLLDKSSGSYQIWLHLNTRKRVIVPMHNKDLPTGTFDAILKQAGINKEKL